MPSLRLQTFPEEPGVLWYRHLVQSEPLAEMAGSCGQLVELKS